jgi:hypothetical protein
VPRAKENSEITVVAPSAPLTRRSAWPLGRAVLSARLALSAVDVVGFPGVPRSPREVLGAAITVDQCSSVGGGDGDSPGQPERSEQPRPAPRRVASPEEPRGAPRSPEEPREAPRSPDEPLAPRPAETLVREPRGARLTSGLSPPLAPPQPAAAPAPGSPLLSLDRAPSRPALPLTSVLSALISPKARHVSAGLSRPRPRRTCGSTAAGDVNGKSN